MKMIPGKPNRPKFRVLASGSSWIRAGEGGLLDMFVGAGTLMKNGEVVAEKMGALPKSQLESWIDQSV